MKPVAIFQHDRFNFPAGFLEFLENHAIPHRHFRLDRGDPVPAGIDGVSGLCFLGGIMSVNDECAWIEDELRIIRQAQAAGMPVIGHCLGGQLISKALGGTVARNPNREIGWHHLRRSENAGTERWLGDLADPLVTLQWHSETFTVPPGATHLLASDYCANQAFAIGNTLGLQGHIEVTAEVVRNWIRDSWRDLLDESESVHDRQAVLRGVDQHLGDSQRLAARLYNRWIEAL